MFTQRNWPVVVNTKQMIQKIRNPKHAPLLFHLPHHLVQYYPFFYPRVLSISCHHNACTKRERSSPTHPWLSITGMRSRSSYEGLHIFSDHHILAMKQKRKIARLTNCRIFNPLLCHVAHCTDWTSCSGYVSLVTILSILQTP